MTLFKKTLAGLFALCIGTVSIPVSDSFTNSKIAVSAAEDISSKMEWDTMKIGGGGFVSGIVTGQKEMYLRTDVGGAYKYDYTKKKWVQLFASLNEEERGYLSVKGMAIDPNDDNIVYFLCGCAYFSGAGTVIYKTTDGGKTFTKSDVTDLIQVHGNGDGRECCEPIAIDPDDPDTIYVGGDVTAGSSALIKSTDGGKTWNPVKGYDDLGLFNVSLKYPMWTEHMVRGTESKEYNQQNGIATILVEGGKVYVGTSVTGQANIHVADVKDDKFTELSADLPNANYPVSITSDKNGNLFFTYIAGLAFSGAVGGAYKYNVESGKVSKLSVTDNAVGMITVDKNDPNKMVARTCGLWSDQWYEKEWIEKDPNDPNSTGSIAWGDHFFRSTDGGETWQDITPGQGETIYDANGSHKEFVSLPMDTNGYDWIYGKACHWGSGILIDPRDPDRILMTSGNGVFACDNVWEKEGIQFYFQPDGVEEVVALDMVSVPGGAAYSAIGDYDGFIHENDTDVPQQYKPNIGSTSAIAYCPQNPDVMVRVSEHGSDNGNGYYSTDAGKTWTKMEISSGGKVAITQLDDDTYRVIKASGDNSAISYTDDFGATWKNSSGLNGSRTTYPLVDPNNPAIVYGSGIKHNDYWASDPNKKEPTLDESHYSFYISTDYGATFKETVVSKYDQCDHTGDLAYITDDTLAMAVGWHGMYIITDGGSKIEKSDVFYAKTVGYGKPEKDGGVNTLFIYGKPAETDTEGIYRSTDGGKTWTCINTDHLYGGTGNGNFLVGDMNEFGKVYMSTVGCGIVVGRLSTGQPDNPDDKTVWGDANCDGKVDMSDAVLVMQSLSNPDKYGLNGSDPTHITEKGQLNADVYENGTSGITNEDALQIQKFKLELIDSLDPKNAK